MARETVAQRNARFETERQARLAEETALYPTRLLDMLERATRLSYELTVKDAQFVVSDRNSRATWAMTPLYTPDSQANLEALMYDVEELEERRKMEQMRYEMKQAALAKLTDTEKTLLGLK